MSAFQRIALIGFGEVGQTLAEDLAGRAALSAWDVQFPDPQSLPRLGLARRQVRVGRDAQDAVADAELVISAVTADQDLAAARSITASLPRGAFFLDLNSCSPGQKLASAEVIEAAGGRYVEAAVMSPIGPKRIGSPMLLGGAHAAEFMSRAGPLGFTGARPYAERIGQAAATKLCRSVMIKGVEALLTESMLAARHYGVEQEVLASLSDLLPIPDWEGKAQYMIGRSLEHGTRRAEEMREAARTVAEAGIEPTMSAAIAERQAWAASFRDALSGELAAMLDAINEGRSQPKGRTT
jgi:3-hydroxyisobutyrate dehydrogenase-like beta-hydroxyacid dehydrogenase